MHLDPMELAREIERLIAAGFPADPDVPFITVETLEPHLTLRLRYHQGLLRPGEIISGPTLMKLADTSMWAACMALQTPRMSAEEAAHTSFTTSLNINFLRKADAADLLAHARIVKFGRTLAVGEIEIFSGVQLVATASVTYAVSSS